MRNRLPRLVVGTFFGFALAAAHAATDGKVTLCHHRPGNPSSAQPISVSEDAVAAHLNHGDTLGECELVCSAGQHDCGGTCVSNNSAESCGTSCTPCSAPADATATCDGTACGVVCDAGHHDCGGVCVSNNSTASCGDRCTRCVAPLGATATCDGTECGIDCNGTAIPCGGQCVNPLTDANNCGGCGVVCSGVCTGGYCY